MAGFFETLFGMKKSAAPQPASVEKETSPASPASEGNAESDVPASNDTPAQDDNASVRKLSFEDTQSAILAELNELEEMLKMRKSPQMTAAKAASESPAVQMTVVDRGAVSRTKMEEPAIADDLDSEEPVEQSDAPDEAKADEIISEEVIDDPETPEEEVIDGPGTLEGEAIDDPETPEEDTADNSEISEEGMMDNSESPAEENSASDFIHEEFTGPEILQEEYSQEISQETAPVEPAVIDPIEYTKANSPFMYYETVDADDVLPEEEPEQSFSQRVQAEEAEESLSEEAADKDVAADDGGPEASMDDILLVQIDELRKKAVELKKALSDKENRVEELEQVVAERSEKAAELKEILEERQAKADGVTSVVELQLDKLIDNVENHMVTIERSMHNDIAGVSDSVTRGVNAHMDKTMGIMQNQVGALQNNVGSLKNDVDAFRNHMDRRMDELQQKAGKGQNAELCEMIQDDNDALLEELENLKQELRQMKTDVNEKLHRENVNSSNCVKSLIRETDAERKKVDEEVDSKLAAIKKQNTTLTVVTVINIAIVIAVALRFLGIY